MSDEIKLNDLRRFAILNRTAITYRSSRDGRTVVINRQGLVQVPGLASRPTFNAEDLLSVADDFRLDPETGAPRTVLREELAGLLKKLSPAAAPAKEE